MFVLAIWLGFSEHPRACLRVGKHFCHAIKTIVMCSESTLPHYLTFSMVICLGLAICICWYDVETTKNKKINSFSCHFLVMLPKVIFYKANSLTSSGSCLYHSPAIDEQDRHYFPGKLSVQHLCVDFILQSKNIFDEKEKQCHTAMTTANYQQQFSRGGRQRESQTQKHPTSSLSSSLQQITASSYVM